MKQPEDVIWDTITTSAKSRIDYNDFKASFDGFGNQNMIENVLFMMMCGCVAKKPVDAIAQDVNRELLPLGLVFPDAELQSFLNDNANKLKNEIRATDIALSLLAQGRQIPGVLVQVKSILTTE